MKDETQDEDVWFAGDILNRKSEEQVQDADMRDLDDDEGYYLVLKGEQIMFRYEVIKPLGKGSFA